STTMTYVPETPQLKKLQDTLTEQPSFCNGILELPSDQLELYYGRDSPRYVDFAKSALQPDAVAQLAAACQPAMFGRGDETVLDETYRKAGKMDAHDFVMRFNVEETGLMRAIHAHLLRREREGRNSIRAELYKLNVYSEGQFFKAHTDTPRSQDMFGSLVIVFPTPHEGGTLILREDDKEWAFDSATLLAGRNDAIAYVAFFSDVEHEVAPVLSGHRVTVTYNLFYAPAVPSPHEPAGLTARAPGCVAVDAISAALIALLDDPAFMAQGGTLGFGLRHKYPLPKTWSAGDPDPLGSLAGWLKGADYALFRAAETVGLTPRLRLLVYTIEWSGYRGQTVVLSRMPDLDGWMEDEPLSSQLEGTILRTMKFGKEAMDDGSDGEDEDEAHVKGPEIAVHFVTEAFGRTKMRAPHATYGNEASVEYTYASVCLLVTVGEPGMRGAIGEVAI
ncbi:uncharacterized protein BXZ73DRAFT_50901, partial [Epithele typhae]|uniref:uncharacterized protein n=1 Tax=Epithele typhae TaxID=378194 RepID=UPI002008487D